MEPALGGGFATEPHVPCFQLGLYCVAQIADLLFERSWKRLTELVGCADGKVACDAELDQCIRIAACAHGM
jgi:hypothetical protein